VLCPYCKSAIEVVGSRSNVLKENLEAQHQLQVVHRGRCLHCRLSFQWETAVLVIRMPSRAGP
jgi:hypothetical protein